MMKTILLAWALFLCSMTTLANTPATCDLNFAVVPQQSATVLAKKWIPILKQVSEESGCEIRFATNKDIPTFEAKLKAGEYDLAYMNPYHYTVFSKAPGYLALVHRAKQPIRGILVVKKGFDEAAAHQLLADQTLAFPAPAAFAATILNQKKLERQGIRFDSQYVSSHDSVYLSVSKGLFVAGGGVMRTFNTMPEDVRDQLKILWKTDPFTPHAIAAHPRLSEAQRNRVAAALVTMSKTEEGSQLLKSIKVKHGFELPKAGAWQDVDALGISLIE